MHRSIGSFLFSARKLLQEYRALFPSREIVNAQSFALKTPYGNCKSLLSNNGIQLHNSPLNWFAVGLAFLCFWCLIRLIISLYHKWLILHGSHIPYPSTNTTLSMSLSFSDQSRSRDLNSGKHSVSNSRQWLQVIPEVFSPSAPQLSSPTAQSTSLPSATIKNFRHII